MGLPKPTRIIKWTRRSDFMRLKHPHRDTIRQLRCSMRQSPRTFDRLAASALQILQRILTSTNIGFDVLLLVCFRQNKRYNTKTPTGILSGSSLAASGNYSVRFFAHDIGNVVSHSALTIGVDISFLVSLWAEPTVEPGQSCARNVERRPRKYLQNASHVDLVLHQ